MRQCPYCDGPSAELKCPQHRVPTIDVRLLELPPKQPAPGMVLVDRYELIEQIGEGLSGTVFRAQQLAIGREVAVKVLRSRTYHGSRMLMRFFREALTLARLNHPNVVQLIELNVDEPTRLPFMACELVKGRTLTELIREEGPFPERRTASLMAQVARAMTEAHGSEIIHRDLKPNNVMVAQLADGDELVKVLDFGLAKLTAPEVGGGLALTAPGKFVGTPHFASPEQSLGGDIDQRSDLYSLGCLMHACLTGTAPFLARDGAEVVKMHRTQPIPALPSSLAGGAPPSEALEMLHQALLSKRPEKRPSDAGEVALLLGRIARGESIEAETVVLSGIHTTSSNDAETAIDTLVDEDAATPVVLRDDVTTREDPTVKRPPRKASSSRSRLGWVAGAVTALAFAAGAFLIRPAATPVAAVEPAPPSTPPPVEAVVSPRRVMVIVDSEPSGAAVRVAGTVIGQTPAELALESPTEVELSLAGHQARTVTVRVEDAPRRSVKLTPNAAKPTAPPPPRRPAKTKPKEGYRLW